MEQVRVVVSGHVYGKFKYMFDRGRSDWVPVFEDGYELVVSEEAQAMLEPLQLIPREDLPWRRVQALVPAAVPRGDGYQLALQEAAPESGSFILFSLRRRDLNKRIGAEQELTGEDAELNEGHPRHRHPSVAVSAGGGTQAAGGWAVVEHVTKRGKTLRGIIRSDLTQDQAKAIDPYTFKKGTGWFIREDKSQ